MEGKLVETCGADCQGVEYEGWWEGYGGDKGRERHGQLGVG